MSRRTRALGAFFSSLLGLALGGCGGDEPQATRPAFDLLARTPDLIVDQPGEVRPAEEHWSDYAYDGWEFLGSEHETVWAVARRASLRLPILVTGDVTLELELVGPAAPTKVALTLNGNDLGALEVGPEPSRHVVTAPAGFWQRGDNVFSLQGSALGEVSGKNVYFGLRDVRYAKARLRIEHGPKGCTLPAGCSIAYRLELLAHSQLVLRGRARGEGRLELRPRLVDPISGDDQGERIEPESFPARDSALDLRRTLPRGAGVVEFHLTWLSSDPSSHFEVEGLGVEELPGAHRPSILFVSIDTLSAQHLSLYGYARKTTPNLEAFARDAVVFRNCRANAPWTIPSYMSQFTGLFPRAHMIQASLGEGRLDPTPWETQQMAPSRWTLAEFFRAAGYRTAAFVDNPWLTRGFGFRQGFEDFDGAAADIALSDPDGGLRNIAPRALEWLDERAPDEPFFLFVQAFDTHAPYHTDELGKTRFDGDGKLDPSWTIPVGRQQAFSFGCVPSHIAYELSPGHQPPERMAVAPLDAAYDEKIAIVDETLAQLFAGLKQRGLYDELLIVFSADHGESTINHDLFFSHALLYNDALHVPLVVKLPHQEEAGRVVEPLVQLVDLYPTLVEYVRPEARRAVHGSSLLGLLHGDEAPARMGFAEGGMMEQFSIEQEGWKLIVTKPLFGGNQTQLTHPRLDREGLGKIAPELATGFYTNTEIAAVFDKNPKARKFVKTALQGPFYELYYLPDDPAELDDLSKAQPERVAQMLVYGAQEKEIGERAKAQAVFAMPPVQLGAEDMEEMKALGYVGE